MARSAPVATVRTAPAPAPLRKEKKEKKEGPWMKILKMRAFASIANRQSPDRKLNNREIGQLTTCLLAFKDNPESAPFCALTFGNGRRGKTINGIDPILLALDDEDDMKDVLRTMTVAELLSTNPALALAFAGSKRKRKTAASRERRRQSRRRQSRRKQSRRKQSRRKRGKQKTRRRRGSS